MKLKFRVWDIKRETFLNPFDEIDPQLSLKDFGDGCDLYLYNREAEAHVCRGNSHYIIEQYTGLTDRNGQEIYEGDILIFKGDNASPYSKIKRGTRIVQRYHYDNNLYLFGINEDGSIGEHPASGFQLNTTTRTRFTKIGNIHENKLC